MKFGSEAVLKEAISYTSKITNFSPLLIEKDYYCSLLLKSVFRKDSTLVFKGGTLLSKVYCNFFRLSEDLGFSLSLSPGASRQQRRNAAKEAKDTFANACKEIKDLTLAKPLEGRDESRQYIGEVHYQSLITGAIDRIRIDVGLREEVIQGPKKVQAKTLLLDPISGSAAVDPIDVRGLSFEEAVAEKIRATLTREPPAIRDLFDMGFVISMKDFDMFSRSTLDLARNKIVVQNAEVDLSSEKKRVLRKQLDTDLAPVLSPDVAADFSFDSAFGVMERIAERLALGKSRSNCPKRI